MKARIWVVIREKGEGPLDMPAVVLVVDGDAPAVAEVTFDG